MKRRLVLIIIGLISLTLFLFAINLENADSSRFYLLLGLFALLIIIIFVRYMYLDNTRIYSMLLFAAIVISLILENNSRYSVNYFFHFYYLLIILEGTYILPLKQSIYISSIALITSMFKYIYILEVQLSIRSIIELVFFFMLNGLIIVIATFAKYYVIKKQNTDELYSELLDAHEKLKLYSEQISQLSVLKERNRIARDLHDTLGHSMAGLIMQLELAENYVDGEPDKAKDYIIKSKESSRESLRQIREVVDTLKGQNEFNGLESITNLVSQFQINTQISTKLIIKGKERKLTPEGYVIIYRFVQEGLTNTAKHSNASFVEVVISFLERQLIIYITDNGSGCNNVKEGNGLTGMRERLNNINGRIEYSSQRGFMVKAIIPLEKVSVND